MKHKSVTILGIGIAGLAIAITLKTASVNIVLIKTNFDQTPFCIDLNLGSDTMKAIQAIEQSEKSSAHNLREILIK